VQELVPSSTDFASYFLGRLQGSRVTRQLKGRRARPHGGDPDRPRFGRTPGKRAGRPSPHFGALQRIKTLGIMPCWVLLCQTKLVSLPRRLTLATNLHAKPWTILSLLQCRLHCSASASRSQARHGARSVIPAFRTATRLLRIRLQSRCAPYCETIALKFCSLRQQRGQPGYLGPVGLHARWPHSGSWPPQDRSE
jgi:hypothetical protein